MALADAVSYVTAHFPLDEASGNALETIGGLDATDNNTVGSGTGIVLAGARDFELSNSEYFSRSDNTAFGGGDIDFMIRVWVKFESLASSYYGLVNKDNIGVARGYLLLYDFTNTRIGFAVSSDGTSNTPVYANNFGAPSTGTWYLIHAWHDSTANQIGISVNAGTADTASHSAGMVDDTTPLIIGSLYVGSSAANFHDGLMNDLVIMKNRFLDATERSEDYNSGTGVAFADWAGGGGGTDATELMGRPFGLSGDRQMRQLLSY